MSTVFSTRFRHGSGRGVPCDDHVELKVCSPRADDPSQMLRSKDELEYSVILDEHRTPFFRDDPVPRIRTPYTKVFVRNTCLYRELRDEMRTLYRTPGEVVLEIDIGILYLVD